MKDKDKEFSNKGKDVLRDTHKDINVNYEGSNNRNVTQIAETIKNIGPRWWVVAIVVIIILSVTVPIVIFLAKPGIYYINTIEYEVDGKRYTVNADYKEKVKIEIPYKIGYNFMGLYDENGLVLSFDENGYSISEWIYKTRGEVYRLFPVFEPIIFSVSLDAVGGFFSINGRNEEKLDNLYGIKYEENLSDIENIPLRKGYIFSGWALNDGTMVSDESGKIFDEKKQFGSELCSIAESCDNVLNLYARWNPISYNVVFCSNTAGEETYIQKFVYDKSQELNGNIFRKEGYNFSCWNTQADGSGTSFDNEEEVVNLCSEEGKEYLLYAQWTKQSIKDVTYIVNNKGTATVTGFSESISSNADTLEIPSELDGYTVSVIANGAFKDCNFTSIYIPNTVTEIGEKIFAGAENLETVIVEGGNEVYFSENNGIIRREDGALVAGCKTTVISKNVKIIKKGAFDSISLKIVEIPSTVNLVEFEAFKNCGTETITVDENNQFYYKSSSAVNAIISKEPSGVLIAKQEPGTLIYGCQNTNIPQEYNVTSIGDYAFAYTTMETVNLPATLKTIGENAFSNCVNLSSITMPASVTNIKESAFSGCEKLTNIVFGNNSMLNSISESAFENCSLKTVEIPTAAIKAVSKVSLTSVKIINGSSIDDNAFSGCTELISITIPSTVTTIGNNAFSGCTSLVEIELGAESQLIAVGAKSFSGCADLISITIPSTVKAIGDSAFNGCTSLAEINIPVESQLNTVGVNAFNGCVDLMRITIPSKLITIGASAFNGCSSLAELNFAAKSQLNYIGVNAFKKCINLTSLKIPSTVRTIGASAFSGCTSLVRILFDEESLLENIGDNVFVDCPIQTAEIPTIVINAMPKGNLTSVTITSGLSIVDNAFSGCNILKSVSIPTSVTTIGDNAFMNCSSLSAINIETESQLNSFGASAFNGCSSLTSLTIPSTVITIGDSAFKGCTALTQILFNGKSLLEYIADNAFSGCPIEIAEIPNVAIKALSKDSLTSVKIVNGFDIKENSFSECVNLTNITIPSTVTVIGDSAFSGCISLAEIGIEADSNLNTIGANAFKGCVQLLSITISSNVKTIGDSAFSGCNNLIIHSKAASKPEGWVDGWNGDKRPIVWGSGTDKEKVELDDFLWEFTDGHALLIRYLGSSETVIIDGNVEFLGNKYCVFEIGETAFYKNTYITTVSISNDSQLKKIANSLFADCINLKRVNIPESVTNIGAYAFIRCSKLNSVKFEGNSQLTTINWGAFQNCDSLENIIIPDKVTDIGGFAFSGCTNLTSITILGNLSKIDVDAFSECNKLNAVHISDLSAWCMIDFYNIDSNPLSFAHNLYLSGELMTEMVIPDSAISIGKYAFYNCNNLTKVNIPERVTSIGEYAFYGCDNALQIDQGVSYIDRWIIDFDSTYMSVSLRNNTIGIADSAFSDCRGLMSVTIPNGVKSIGDGAFSDCRGLTSVTIPASVTKIGSRVFSYCNELNTIEVEFGNLVYHSANNCLIETASKRLIAGCISSIIPLDGSVTSIGDYAFSGRDLKSITIPTEVTSIGDFAFDACRSLSSVTIPDSVTSIGDYVFRGCSYLTSVTIPDSVTSIGAGAFEDCSNLTSVTFGENSQLTSIGDYAFYNGISLTSMTIPDSVTSIGLQAFYNCFSITSMTIPASVTSIGAYAFSGCDNISKVYYRGTDTDWNGIELGSNNTYLTSATRYYYSENRPNQVGNYWHYVDGVLTIW